MATLSDERVGYNGPWSFPIKVSQNGRYFVDQKDRPVFWLGTTQWHLFRDYTLDEARDTIEACRRHGFAFAQVMVVGVGDGTTPNRQGEKPWINDDPLTPNEAYFRHVDAVLQLALDSNLVISLTMYHQSWRGCITPEKARAYGLWLARRYKDMPNIVWAMNPEAKPEFIPIIQDIAAGLREGDAGRHMITFKPDPSPYSSSHLPPQDWLDFNAMQVWKDIRLIYPFVTHDYNLTPVKPVLMGEGAYEAGSEYGFDVTPLWVRRQAYYSFLAGAAHTYGHNDSWRVLPTWRQALDAPAAVQMGLLKQIFLARSEWWRLVPDQSVFASGGNTEGDLLRLAARHADGRWLMIYLADQANFSIDMSKLAPGRAKASWIDPRTAGTVPASVLSGKGIQEFSTPAGWEDALLVIETA